MFHDDSMKSFFRRLSFTPDGSLLLTPGVLNKPGPCQDTGLSEFRSECQCIMCRDRINAKKIRIKYKRRKTGEDRRGKNNALM